MAHGFGANVIGYDAYPNEAAAAEHGVTYAKDLDDLLARSDVISLHCPLFPSTKYMINDKTKPSRKIKWLSGSTMLIRAALSSSVALEDPM